jgi:broad specificity phosphatase PhoE
VGQVLLVRHGQASFGADDYDVLSDLGWTQGRVLGARLVAEGLAPTVLVTGGMRRHAETAAAIAEGAGWADVPVEVDPGWAEFDHLGVVAALPDAGAVEAGDRRGFQRVFERATARWASGEHDDDYAEPYADFVARASEALARACDRAGPVVVVSSGGPVAVACAALVAAGAPAGTEPVLPTLWRHFNTVQVNAGVTRVLVGPSGRRLLTFNEHGHLGPEAVSYR